MKKLGLVVLASLLVAPGLQAAVVFVDLGTSAPPAGVGLYAVVTPFDTAPQAAIADGTNVTTIPGAPFGTLTSSTVNKRTVPGGGWATWSHGYTGPVFTCPANTCTLTLPAATGAFYFYAEPNVFQVMTVTATTDSGATSGPINVNGQSGANGIAFYTTQGEALATITVTTSDTSFAMGEFGAARVGMAALNIPTLSPWALAALGAVLAVAGAFLLKKRA